MATKPPPSTLPIDGRVVGDQGKTYDVLLAEVTALRRRIATLDMTDRRAPPSPADLTAAEPAEPYDSGAPLIFVSIAAYSDPELPRTLRDCIENAAHPEALRFGICWQYDTKEPIDLDEFRDDGRFQFADFPIEESEGGPWARGIAQQFWDCEPYTFQVDSHMKFEPDWDARLVAMLDRLPGDRPLISVNSPLFWYDDAGDLHRQTHVGVPTTKIGNWKASLGWAPWFDWGRTNTQRPGWTRFISGNFVFTLGQWNAEVPQDPDQYYWGEEFSLTVRSFTSGYDLHLPDEIVAWHMYHRDSPPRRHWEHGPDVVEKKKRNAFERLRRLVYSDDENENCTLGRFGLGRVRTKRDYEIYAGMDLARKCAHPNVYSGDNPDPVTIKSEQDWNRCLTIDDHRRVMEVAATVEQLKSDRGAHCEG